MKAVIEIIKRYLVEVICGLAAVLGIALIVLGLGQTGKVKSTLQEALQVRTEIANMARGNVYNSRAVQQRNRHIAGIRAGFEQVLAFMRERNAYPPLVPAAFPGGTNEDINNAIAFRRAFQPLRSAWLKQIKAGAEPTPAEISAEKDRMEAERKAQGLPVKEVAEPGEITPEMSAAIRTARSIYCYATPDSFQDSPISAPGGPMDAGPPPNLEQMWNAQLEVWIQQSVVDAIAAINEAAASDLQARGVEPWVGNLPIKDLRFLQTSRYYVKEGLTQATTGTGTGTTGAKDRPYPSGDPTKAFTGRQSNDQYELMHFTVQLVVDARDLPRVLAGLCEKRFHVPLNVQYESLPLNAEMVGKIYGEAPVVLATIEFETVFFSELYLPLMPDPILTLLGKQRPEPPPTTTGA